jgi:uncharacterized protein YyaL (SSP411 family)
MIEKSAKKSNRLINTTSPYLLQHAYNPVDWFEWGADALEKAKKEDKPILVSIGYSSCHWCHVMERECFEKEEIAAIMNEHFVCIKVDREERPDIDQIYMESVQAMQQHGGWPLNVFLTPDQKPFYGGTYFPPAAWVNVLQQLSVAFRQRRKEIDESAEDLRKHLQTSDLQRFANVPDSEKFKRSTLDAMFIALEKRFDKTWGGMDKAPKFVMPTIWMFMLRYFHLSGKQEALDMVVMTLEKMTKGGLYDQVGGGFSRYSVDAEWFAPHFEKMLYDNAQLLSLYSEAYAITKNEIFRDVVYETVKWLKREMMHPEGGFYSALDADSEGVEGKFYTWTREELKSALGDDFDQAAKFFQINEDGNWEHGRNILLQPDDAVTDTSVIKRWREKLLHIRSTRIRPGLDDKILAGWNAMTVQGLIDAYRAFGDPQLLQIATKNIEFLESRLIADGKVYRAFKDKHSETEGFLEDYAFVIQAYASLYQVTFSESTLMKAKRWCEYTLTNFHDPGEGYFHFSSSDKLIARKKEVFDNVIPSSNSVMARNLNNLGTLLDLDDWKKMSIEMTSKLANLIEAEPGYMSNWGVLLTEMVAGLAEVVISGPDNENMRKELHGHYHPFSLTLGTQGISTLPLLVGRESKDAKTLVYVCFNKTCKLPVDNVRKAIMQLENR